MKSNQKNAVLLIILLFFLAISTAEQPTSRLIRTTDGVVAFHPENVHPTLPDNEIYIDDVQVDGKKIQLRDTVKLNRNFERIIFYISSPYFGNPNNLNFEVKLSGPEPQDWMDVPKDHSISFTKLKPGTYKLAVRKLIGFDSAYKYKNIIIVVESAIWQTSWFKMLLIIVLILCIYLFYKLRTNYINNRNLLLQSLINEKTYDLKNTISTLRATKDNLNQQIENNTKIIQYITHDIKSPLKFMALASKYMYDSFDENSSDLRENIKAIFTSSTQMYNFVDNLLDYSKAYLESGDNEIVEFNLYEIVSQKTTLFEGIASSQKTILKNSVSKGIKLTVNKQLLSIILHNLLDNAIKHTYQGIITIKSYSESGKTFISIRDTGSGFEAHELKYYRSLLTNYDFKKPKDTTKMGLFIVIELMLILNGTLVFNSKKGSGTEIIMGFEETGPL